MAAKRKTDVLKFMAKHKITTYAVIKTMNFNPTLTHNLWARRLSGQALMTVQQIDKLKIALHKLAQGYNPEVSVEPVKFRIK